MDECLAASLKFVGIFRSNLGVFKLREIFALQQFSAYICKKKKKKIGLHYVFSTLKSSHLMLGLAVRTEYGMNPNILPTLTPEPCDMEILDTMANKLSSEAERIWDFFGAFR